MKQFTYTNKKPELFNFVVLYCTVSSMDNKMIQTLICQIRMEAYRVLTHLSGQELITLVSLSLTSREKLESEK